MQVRTTTYPLFELLVDSVQRILDGNALHVPCRDLEPQREVQGDLLDLGYAQWQSEIRWVLDCRW